MSEEGLSGLRVAVFQARHAEAMANLIRKAGAEPLGAPTMREVPLTVGPELEAFVEHLRRGEVEVLLVLTGVGHRALVEVLQPIVSAEELAQLLSSVTLAARGPKAVAAIRELGLSPEVTAPAPHTWQDLYGALRKYMVLQGALVGLQQYGVPHRRLTEALASSGARVVQVPVYRWELPENLAPIEHSLDEIIAGKVQVALFTSAPQAGHLLKVAEGRGQADALKEALGNMAVGSVGPSCTEGLRELGLEPDFEPSNVKMAPLVREASRCARQVLAGKAGQAP